MAARRIAVLIDNIESDYHVQMLLGVVKGARAADVQVLIVAGAWISTAAMPTARNFAYDLVARAGVDGVLVMAGSLSNFCGMDRFQAWLSAFAGVPVVCIQLPVEERASVYVDNGAGVRAAVTHLIEHHQRRRIAYFRGPTHSGEAEARYAAYVQTLEAHGLAVDPALTVPGQTLSRQDGELGVRVLFEERGLAPAEVQAIACVNDDVALGALEALTRRGIAVPEPMGLVGFDDGPNASAANPPLTTVNQRVAAQGQAAARVLIEALEQGVAPRSEQIASEAVFRSSCGCRVRFLNDSRTNALPLKGLARRLGLALTEHRAMIRAELARAAAGRFGSQSGWEERLLNALAQELDVADGRFVATLEAMARRSVVSGGTVDACDDVLTQVRLQVLRMIDLEPGHRPLVEDTFQEARAMLSRVALSAYRERDQASLAHVRSIAKACLEVVGSGSFDGVRRALTEHLPGLGIRACVVSRLTTVGAAQELVVLARQTTELESASALVMDATRLGIDTTLEHHPVVVIEPLDFGGVPVGLASFAWGAHNPIQYEQLREFLSVAVHATPVG